MGCTGQLYRSVRHCRPRHLKRFLEIFGAVIDAWQQMAVKVDHETLTVSLQARPANRNWKKKSGRSRSEFTLSGRALGADRLVVVRGGGNGNGDADGSSRRDTDGCRAHADTADGGARTGSG